MSRAKREPVMVSEQDLGTRERLAKAIVAHVVRPGTQRIERVEIVTAAHRLFKTGSPELLAAEKYRTLAEIAAGARQDGFDRVGGDSSPPWSRTPASEPQMQAMEAIRAAHELTMRYRGGRILPLVLVDGVALADADAELRVRKGTVRNALRVILGILAGADSRW